MIFDTHAHYDEEQFDGDRDELLERLHREGIVNLVNVGYSKASIASTHALADRYDFIYEALGFHPDETWEMEQEEETILPWLREQLTRPKAVAVGEIGLDYYWDKTPREVQRKWFRRQLELARELNLPVVIHSREAAQDTMDILREMGQGLTLDMHCYSYSLEMAKEYLNMGYYLGVGGVITFKNARKLKEVVEYMPLERILLETDCPYLAPVPFRGKRNDSGKIPLVIDAIAQIKGLEREQVEEVCLENAGRFYGIKDKSSGLESEAKSHL